MAFDIYRLRRGHCEVHPDIPEPCPCYLCYQEQLEKGIEERWRKSIGENMRKKCAKEAQDEA